MGISSKAIKLQSLGFTNKNTEDIGALASSIEKKLYDWYCSSPRCCLIEKEFYSRKAKKMIKVKKHINKVLKFSASFENHSICPDCKNLLFSLRVR